MAKQAKIPKAEKHIAMAKIVDGNLALVGSEFPVNFFRVTDVEGNHIILKQQDESGIVALCSEDYVVEEVMRYCEVRPSFGVDNKNDARSVVDWWLALSKSIEMPPPFRWLDEYGLTFSRLPWPMGASGPTPTWDKIGHRMTNFAAFKCFIGSLFDAGATHQQYVWCYGGGGNGKSAIDRVLSRVFGPSYKGAMPPKDRTGFWLRGLVGKRLVVFPDCSAKGFPASGFFKSLCANDAMEVEEKGGPTVTMRLGCRFIFLSNDRPTLSSEDADSRRVIFCELGKPSDGEMRPGFEDDLWAEAGHFVTTCIQSWETRKARGTSGIETDRSQITDIVQDVEAHFEETLDYYFTIDKGQPSHGISPINLQRCLAHAYKKRSDQMGFRDWLERFHGIRKLCVRDENSKVIKVYPGLFMKSDVATYTRQQPGNVSE